MPVTQQDIDNSIKQRDAAQAAFNSSNGSLDSWFALIKRCCYKDATLVYAEPSEVTCQKCWSGCNDEHSGCCSKDTCESNMASYNQAVNSYELAQDNLSKAEDELARLQDELAGQEDNNYEAAENEEDRKSDKKRWQYIIFGIIVLGLIIGGTLITIKVLSKQ